MAYPQGFLFQPPASLALPACPALSPGLVLGRRTEQLSRSSSGSAFAPYPGSAAPSDFSPQLQYGVEQRAATSLSPFLVSVWEPCSGSGCGLSVNGSVLVRKGQRKLLCAKQKLFRISELEHLQIIMVIIIKQYYYSIYFFCYFFSKYFCLCRDSSTSGGSDGA